jgi:hypothetical protein
MRGISENTASSPQAFKESDENEPLLLVMESNPEDRLEER